MLKKVPKNWVISNTTTSVKFLLDRKNEMYVLSKSLHIMSKNAIITVYLEIRTDGSLLLESPLLAKRSKISYVRIANVTSIFLQL